MKNKINQKTFWYKPNALFKFEFFVVPVSKKALKFFWGKYMFMAHILLIIGSKKIYVVHQLKQNVLSPLNLLLNLLKKNVFQDKHQPQWSYGRFTL
jgi:hypothetical protein